MIANMETIAKEQLLVRVKPALLARLKWNAKKEDISMNAYVERELEAISKPVLPKLPKDFEISPFVRAMSGIIPMPTQEMLDADPKLAYILGK